MIRHDKETAQAVIDLTTKYKIWLILGSDDAEPHADFKTYKDADYYNSSFAISPEGRIAGFYRKRRLVIFGEYVPFVKWLPFLQKLSGGDVGFTPGEKPSPFALTDLKVTASVLICFEDTFPHLVPEYVTDDVDFLLNLTNNGWFGESAAQWQHAANAVFRAVENNIPLVRCANNGLTCWVDELGRMHSVYFPGSSNVYQAGYKIVEVPIRARGETRASTFYTQHGDLFGWSCVAWTALTLILARRRARPTLPAS
jgi:apolipoprotein N-acyltransferase